MASGLKHFQWTCEKCWEYSWPKAVYMSVLYLCSRQRHLALLTPRGSDALPYSGEKYSEENKSFFYQPKSWRACPEHSPGSLREREESTGWALPCYLVTACPVSSHEQMNPWLQNWSSYRNKLGMRAQNQPAFATFPLAFSVIHVFAFACIILFLCSLERVCFPSVKRIRRPSDGSSCGIFQTRVQQRCTSRPEPLHWFH